MPLIDESNNLLDTDLMNRVAEKFSTQDGLIIDNFGNQWYMWRSDGLESWWRFFEETIDAPMGRRLANSSCDEEEYLLNSLELDFTGFFKKKKSQNALKKRWEIHGWGIPQLTPPSFDSPGLTPLFAGIMQADIERINSKRYRMLWEEKTNQTAILTLEESNIPITAAKPSNSISEPGQSLLLELERGWKIDGLSYFLLPIGLFKRLQKSCSGLVANIGEDDRNSWPEFGDGFLSIAIASMKLFIAGEELFLAADANGWLDSCNAYFGSRGYSSPISAKSLDENGGIELKFRTIPCLAITVGHLAGAWVRCEGKPVNVSVDRVEKFDIIQLKSKYEIS